MERALERAPGRSGEIGRRRGRGGCATRPTWRALLALACLGSWIAVAAVPALPGGAAADSATGRSADEDYADAMAREHRRDAPVPSPAATAAPPPRVEAGETTFRSATGKPVRGYLARPVGEGPHPGLIVIHEWWGLNDNIRNVTRQLAARGYDALAVDLYGGRIAEEPDRARQLVGEALSDPEALRAVLRGANTHLASRLGAPRTGAIGWCFGGGLALEAALALPGELDAAVIYYGRVARDPAELAGLTTPILGHFGERDRGIPLASVRAFEAALAARGHPAEIHVYAGADHAFANPSGTRYDAEAAERAWVRTLAFLEAHLRPDDRP